MILAGVTFEVLRFEAVPAGAAVAVVELEGRFAGAAPERPRLLVERPDHQSELPAIDVTAADTWSATFAVPLDALADGATTFTLVPGRGPLIALPAPSAGDDRQDRFVRLARTTNDLRHRLGEAEGLTAERDRLTTEVAILDRRLADAERRAAAAEADVLAARDELAGLTLRAEAGEEGAALARAELADARARIEALERPRASAPVGQAEIDVRDAGGGPEPATLRLPVAAAEEPRAAQRTSLPSGLTPARLLVGGAALLLLVALVAIFLGFGVL